MDLSSRSDQIIENLEYVANDLQQNIVPKVRELQDLSDQGMTPIANIGNIDRGWQGRFSFTSYPVCMRHTHVET